jgi:N-acyl homoserine lactone hydrolase
VHLVYIWDHDIVPGFNFDVEASRRSIATMKDFVAKNNAQVWVNHDKAQHDALPTAPAFVD